MKQICMEIKQTPLKTCAFTGHRTLEKDFEPAKLWDELENLILQGVEIFYNGMAIGFDMLAAEAILMLKKKYPQIKLITCIPFYGQEKYYTDTDKARYARILKDTDEQVVLSDSYTKDAPLKRDRYMADRADVLMAYLKKEKGGTAYTVRYYQKTKPFCKIILL